MPPMSTTNLPKINSNFSIDWLVKSDKSTTNTKNSEKKLPLSAVSSEPLTKDYDQEVSTALRLQTPPNSDDLDAKNDLRANSISPRSEKATNFYDYRNGPMSSPDLHPVRPMPFIPSTAAIDPKMNYFDKSMHPMHQQQNSPTLPHPLSPPMDATLQQQQFLNAHLAAALNYQRQATAGHPQALNFSQIFSNNFHRTSYQMQPWLLSRRFPYGFSGGKC